jgi:rhodanese-related sulfurtransferase
MKKEHSQRFLTLVDAAKKRIKEISPEILNQKMEDNEPLMLIDVREDHEWPAGHIPGAVHLGKGVIERDIEHKIPDTTTQIVLYCSGGYRCALVADALQTMGYSNVYSLETGMQGWSDAGFDLKED